MLTSSMHPPMDDVIDDDSFCIEGHQNILGKLAGCIVIIQLSCEDPAQVVDILDALQLWYTCGSNKKGEGGGEEGRRGEKEGGEEGGEERGERGERGRGQEGEEGDGLIPVETMS